ncbi:MAG: FtsX-like permease family protein [Rhodanobacteraceae bacterium]|jgi:putative ABC transport system permease protein|nr:FtsX-like permease family protein [Rhodanobacteraceae bacterium]
MDELREAVRRVWRSKASSAGLIALLALSIGIGMSVFAVAWSVLWKPLPYPESDRLVNLTLRSSKMGMDLGWSAPYLDHIVRNSQSLRTVAAYRSREMLSADEEGRSLGTAKTVLAQPSLFELLGARPLHGRLVVDLDAETGAERVALVSERYWHRRLNSVDDVARERLVLDGQAYRVVGVLPQEFMFPAPDVDIWLPFEFTPSDVHMSRAGSFGNLRAIGQLSVGAGTSAATMEMSNLVRAEQWLLPIADQIGLQFEAKPIRSIWVEDRRASLLALLVAVTLLLGVTLVNAYSLFLVRQLRRRQEFAVLEAVGETASRRTRRVTLEAALMVALALAIAALLVPAGLEGLARLGVLPEAVPQAVRLDAATLLALLLTGTIAAAVLGSSAWIFRRQKVHEVLRQTGNGQSMPGRVMLLKKALVVGQIAVVFVLLFITLLLMKSSQRLLSEDVGFDRHGSVVGALRPAVSGPQTTPELMRARLAEWIGQVEHLPGVTHVGFSSSAPYGENISLESYRTLTGTSQVAGAEDRAYLSYVSGGYAQALGLKLHSGRYLTQHDAEAQAPVALVDQSLAARHFAGTDPVGEVLTVSGGEGGSQQVTIVGVVGTVRQRDLAAPDEYPSIYLPAAVPYALPGMGVNSVEFVIRGRNPGGLVALIADHTESNSPSIRITDIVTMEKRISNTVAERIRLNGLLQVLSLAALILGSAGLYALLSHVVISRAREMAVRKALGATSRHLLNATLGSGLLLVLIGVVSGLPSAMLGAAILKPMLYEVAPWDPITLIVVCTLLIIVGVLANVVPASRAAIVNPNQVLRSG